MTKKELISIIVPCFNEEEALPLFYKEFNKVAKLFKQDYELILINDGSYDNTLEVMKCLAKKDKHIIYISFSRNFGKESAMYAGLNNAKGDYVAIMDADMQDPPSLLPGMIKKIEKGDYDCVATRRVSRIGESKIRSWFAKKFYIIINAISDANIVDGARDFRLMNRKMVNAILSMSEYNRFSKGIFSWVGFNTYWIEYENVNRVAGTTSWSFWGLVKYAIDGIISFSQTPLSIASACGLIMTIIAFIVLIIIFIRRLMFDNSIQYWTLILCIIIFIGGIQLLCIGIMGQYIGKTHMETKKRPIYIISDSNRKELNECNKK